MLAITMPVRTKPAEKEAFGNTDFWIKLKLITATLMALALTKLKVTRRAVKAGVLNDDYPLCDLSISKVKKRNHSG